MTPEYTYLEDEVGSEEQIGQREHQHEGQSGAEDAAQEEELGALRVQRRQREADEDDAAQQEGGRHQGGVDVEGHLQQRAETETCRSGAGNG